MVLEGQFIHTSREKTSHNNSFETEYFTLGGYAGFGRPIHTYKQREQAIKWSFHNVQFIGR